MTFFKSGIYKITNIQNNKCYIGSAVCIRERWNSHKSLLRKYKHHSKHLQNAWNKWGARNFIFEVLDIVSKAENLIKYEQLWMDELKPEYNECLIAGSCLGVKHSKETKEKIKKATTGRKHTQETKNIMSFLKENFHKEYPNILSGENNGRSKLKEKDVLDIRKLYILRFFTIKELMKQYEVSKRTIHLILRGKTWKNITNDISVVRRDKNIKISERKKYKKPNYRGEKNSFSILKEKQVIEIISKYKTGLFKRKELAREYNISIHTLSNIFYGRNWKHLTGGININKGEVK